MIKRTGSYKTGDSASLKKFCFRNVFRPSVRLELTAEGSGRTLSCALHVLCSCPKHSAEAEAENERKWVKLWLRCWQQVAGRQWKRRTCLRVLPFWFCCSHIIRVGVHKVTTHICRVRITSWVIWIALTPAGPLPTPPQLERGQLIGWGGLS